MNSFHESLAELQQTQKEMHKWWILTEEKTNITPRKEWADERTETIRTKKSCENCGYNTHPEILTKHHIYGRGKADRKALTLKKKRIAILCPNCHSIEHRIKK